MYICMYIALTIFPMCLPPLFVSSFVEIVFYIYDIYDTLLCSEVFTGYIMYSSSNGSLDARHQFFIRMDQIGTSS